MARWNKSWHAFFLAPATKQNKNQLTALANRLLARGVYVGQIRCPKCKERHWVCREALECLESLDLRAKVAALEAEIAELRLRVAPKVDRRAYMREYMRKRRGRV